jgi:hypothetical protein
MFHMSIEYVHIGRSFQNRSRLRVILKCEGVKLPERAEKVRPPVIGPELTYSYAIGLQNSKIL